MPGPPPKPEKMRKLDGYPDHRPPRTGVPDFEVSSRPEVVPEYLGEYGKAFWEEYAPMLQEKGLLTPVDTATFAVLCQSWEDFWIAVRELKGVEVEPPVDDKPDRIKKYAKRKDKAFDKFRKLMGEFGMSPSSRTRIQLADPEDGDDPDDLGENWKK